VSRRNDGGKGGTGEEIIRKRKKMLPDLLGEVQGRVGVLRDRWGEGFEKEAMGGGW